MVLWDPPCGIHGILLEASLTLHALAKSSLRNTERVWRSCHFLGPSLVQLSIAFFFFFFNKEHVKLEGSTNSFAFFFLDMYSTSKQNHKVKCLHKYNETIFLKNQNRGTLESCLCCWAYICFLLCFGFTHFWGVGLASSTEMYWMHCSLAR